MNLSIANLLTILLGRVPAPRALPKTELPSESNELTENKRVATTVRLDPEVKAFVERHAMTMGLSIQDFIGMTMRAVMLASETPKVGELDLLVSRFFDIFSAHEIDAVDIPSLLPTDSLKRADLEHRDRLINALNNDSIRHIAELFLVDETWLKGATNYCLEYNQIQSWYKSTWNFARELLIHKLDPINVSVAVWFVTREDGSLKLLNDARVREDEIAAVDVTPVIVTEKRVNNVHVKTYQVWETQRWNYVNCRLDLKVMLMLCERSRVSCQGIALPNDKYSDFIARRTLPAQALKRPYQAWHIDDVVWDAPQNLERKELPLVEQRYLDAKIDTMEAAISRPYAVTNAAEVRARSAVPLLAKE